MDSENLVDQIVRSLSFEVVAVPQNILQIDSTSKSATPLNLKIRVRKKHDAGLRYGVLSMPKVDTKKNSITESVPERIRLVSSDQTIKSFNVLMEADFDKVTPKHGLEVDNDEDNYQSLSKNTDYFNPLPIISKRNRDIFGGCKPGGCLDPPYGEDKYPYQPTKQNLSLPVKDDKAKLRSSSIFKNNIFKRKKKSSQGDDIYKIDTKYTSKDDSILSLHETGSHKNDSAYSNSIITYPHPKDSGELTAQKEKLNKKEQKSNMKKYHSIENKSRCSIVDDDGSFFILPKKVRNLSNQSDSSENSLIHTKVEDSDSKIIKHDSDIMKLKTENFLNSTTEPHDDFKKGKVESYASNIIPIPLSVPLNAAMNDDKNNTTLEKITLDETFNISRVKENGTQSPNNLVQTEIDIDDQTETLETCENRDSKNLSKHLLVEAGLNYNKVSNVSIVTENGTKPPKNDVRTEIKIDDQTEILEIYDNRNTINLSKPFPDESNYDYDKGSDNVCNSKIELVLPKIKPLNNTDNVTDFCNTEAKKKYLKEEEYCLELPDNIVLLNTQKDIFSDYEKKISTQDSDENQFTISELAVIKNHEDDRSETKLSNTNQSLTIVNKPCIDNINNGSIISNLNSKDQMDTKSDPLVPAKEKSILDIITNLSDNGNETSTENETLKFSENKENTNTVTYSTDDLQHLWKNDAEPLKSIADFISKITLSGTNYNVKNVDVSDEVHLLALETSPENIKLNQEDSAFDSNSVQLTENLDNNTPNFIEEVMTYQNKDETVHETVHAFASETQFISLSESPNTENEIKGAADGNLFDNFEKMLFTNTKLNIEESQSSSILNKDLKEIFTKIVKSDEADLLTSNNLNENSSPTNIDGTESFYLKHSLQWSEKSKSLDFKSIGSKEILDQQNELFEKSGIDTQSAITKHQVKERDSDSNDINNQTIISLTNTILTSFGKGEEKTQDSTRNTSVQLILEVENLKYAAAASTPNNQDDKHFNTDLDNNFVEAINEEDKVPDKHKGDFFYEQTCNVEPELTSTQYRTIEKAGESNFRKDEIFTNENLAVVNKKLPSTTVLQKSILPWKIDIALQSYTDENNERVIKSFDSQKVPTRHPNDTLLTAECYLGSNTNELKIPIDQENELSFLIKIYKSGNQSLLALDENVVTTDQSQNTTKIKIELADKKVTDTTAEYVDYEAANKPKANKFNKMISSDIRDTLNTIYEHELLPLQDIIKGLKEEINTLVAHQMKFKEKLEKLTPKRSKPLRLVNPSKKCVCVRRL